MAPRGALDQLGQALSQIIHAFAEADEDTKIFMAKWDIKDGFWRMDCENGEEYNFAYILLQEEGMPITIVVPTSLQMGWVESPPYFCAATETARDIASDYCDTPVGNLPHHKFAKHVTGAKEFDELPTTSKNGSTRRRRRTSISRTVWKCGKILHLWFTLWMALRVARLGMRRRGWPPTWLASGIGSIL
jgi:hypothetical protein